MTDDPRIAALAEALRSTAGGDWQTFPEQAAAILAALPPGWCGHPVQVRKWREMRAEITRVNALHEDAANEIERLVYEIARLRSIIALHNKTPTGRTRECLPGCIACAALEEKP